MVLQRERITINPVSSVLCPASSAGVAPGAAAAKVGYIRVATFSKQTPEGVRAAIEQLKVRRAQS